jgi:hypothetical protein
MKKFIECLKNLFKREEIDTTPVTEWEDYAGKETDENKGR